MAYSNAINCDVAHLCHRYAHMIPHEKPASLQNIGQLLYHLRYLLASFISYVEAGYRMCQCHGSDTPIDGQYVSFVLLSAVGFSVSLISI